MKKRWKELLIALLVFRCLMPSFSAAEAGTEDVRSEVIRILRQKGILNAGGSYSGGGISSGGTVSTGSGVAFGTGTTPTANVLEWGAGLTAYIETINGAASSPASDLSFFAGTGDAGTGGLGGAIYAAGGGVTDGGESDLFGGNSKGGGRGASIQAFGGSQAGAGGIAFLEGGDAATGVDKDGGKVQLYAGVPTGNGKSVIELWTNGALVAQIDRHGNVVLNATGNALATNATDGFTYIPTCAGTPTGTPTSFTGAAPLVCDSTNHKVYVYTGGAWVALN